MRSIVSDNVVEFHLCHRRSPARRHTGKAAACLVDIKAAFVQHSLRVFEEQQPPAGDKE